MDSQGENESSSAWKWMKTDQFFIPFLNFPVKEIITNWIDELLGLAAALDILTWVNPAAFRL